MRSSLLSPGFLSAFPRVSTLAMAIRFVIDSIHLGKVGEDFPMSNRRLLLVTSRNICNNTGERRLIMNRSEALWREFGIETHVICVVRNARFESALPLPMPPGMEIEYIGYNGFYGLRRALRLARIGMAERLRTGCFGAVVLSGVQVYPLIRNRDSFGAVPVLVDIHGVLEEWIEYPIQWGIRKVLVKPAYLAAKAYEGYAIANSDGCLVVSDELACYVKERRSDIRAFVIPCGTLNDVSIEYDLARSKWRAHFGVDSGEILFVYSGGVSQWQCIGASMALYGLMNQELNGRTRLVLLTSNIAEMRRLAREDMAESKNLVIESLPPNLVSEALCAADVGFLLRECNMTNRVAFPNKFAEYLMAGLVIATSPGLKHPARIIRDSNLGVLLDPNEILCGNINADKLLQLARLIRQRSSDLEAYRDRSAEAVVQHTSMNTLVRPLGGLIVGNARVYQ